MADAGGDKKDKDKDEDEGPGYIECCCGCVMGFFSVSCQTDLLYRSNVLICCTDCLLFGRVYGLV